MGRLGTLIDRALRVFALAEEALAERLGHGPDPALFEQVLAFRFDTTLGPGRLLPVESPASFDLADLVGVERSLEALIRNTDQFVRGLPANHVLLFGERGTGKSSAVRGLLGRFAGQGLRLVEVGRDDLIHLPRVLAALRRDDGRHRFLIFCDDLSFASGEAGYRELKAALEGSIVAPPENVRVIATSNRRHLLPETMTENREARVDERGELHHGEALEEKLALADRFGLVLGFYSFNQDTYLQIVDHYARKAGLSLPADELRAQALRWAVRRASRSGRTGKQFVDDLAGRTALEGD